MYKKLEKPGQKWGGFGWVCLLGNLALMAFYTVVCGWIIYYFVNFLIGNNADLGFNSMISQPSVNVIFLLVTVVIAFVILSFNIQNGLEKVTIYDVRIACADGSFGGKQSVAERRRRGNVVLPQTRFFKD